ncbi:hypothetical protein CDO73_03465 [Saccharibacillus sp. O23]|uniref:hypothetical protein n=1 Tax=Saccharibacillus sp. O23 TaxID=2009338 RepID=UPI000B4E6008|nr:hypothetical protein [Saccharibacillus sp. O23]OWR32671.1 hypothetical protein CDO73_03465 [Saccharibacillus sp. O23]
MRSYYPVTFEIDDHLYRCVWYTEERDGFLSEGNRLKLFDSREDLVAYDKQQGLNIVTEESSTISIDRLRGQFDQLDHGGALDCHEFLNFWNCVSDAAHTCAKIFYGDQDRLTPIYDRVFYGTNPPALRGDGEYFVPAWTKADKKQLKKVFEEGVLLLKTVL